MREKRLPKVTGRISALKQEEHNYGNHSTPQRETPRGAKKLIGKAQPSDLSDPAGKVGTSEKCAAQLAHRGVPALARRTGKRETYRCQNPLVGFSIPASDLQLVLQQKLWDQPGNCGFLTYFLHFCLYKSHILCSTCRTLNHVGLSRCTEPPTPTCSL